MLRYKNACNENFNAPYRSGYKYTFVNQLLIILIGMQIASPFWEAENGALSQRKSSTGGIYLKIPPNHNKREVLHLNSQGCFVILMECVNAGSLIRVQVVRERLEVSSFTLSFNFFFFDDLTLGSHF